MFLNQYQQADTGMGTQGQPLYGAQGLPMNGATMNAQQMVQQALAGRQFGAAGSAPKGLPTTAMGVPQGNPVAQAMGGQGGQSGGASSLMQMMLAKAKTKQAQTAQYQKDATAQGMYSNTGASPDAIAQNPDLAPGTFYAPGAAPSNYGDTPATLTPVNGQGGYTTPGGGGWLDGLFGGSGGGMAGGGMAGGEMAMGMGGA